MLISLNNVNSEVARAHKRIDDISSSNYDLLYQADVDTLRVLRNPFTNYKTLIIAFFSPGSGRSYNRLYEVTVLVELISRYKESFKANALFCVGGNESSDGKVEYAEISFTVSNPK